jgi:hypothetical protein
VAHAKILADVRLRAPLAPRPTRHANLKAVAIEAEVEWIVTIRENELAEDLVSLFVCGLFRTPAEAFGHAKDVRIHRERGQVEEENRRVRVLLKSRHYYHFCHPTVQGLAGKGAGPIGGKPYCPCKISTSPSRWNSKCLNPSLITARASPFTKKTSPTIAERSPE